MAPLLSAQNGAMSDTVPPCAKTLVFKAKARKRVMNKKTDLIIKQHHSQNMKSIDFIYILC